MTHVSERRQTLSRAGFIGATALAGAGIGFILQLLVAYFFGASADTDAYFMAISTSELLSKLLLGGSLTAVFLPVFVDLLVRGQRTKAWGVALNLMHVMVLVLGVLLLLLGVFTDHFVTLIAPGFSDSTHALTVVLIRLMLPAFLLYVIADLVTAMLQALQRFTIPALLRLVAPTAAIVCILMFTPRWGIYALAFGTILSAATQLGLVVWDLRREGFRYHWILRPTDPIIRHLFYLVYPFLASMGVTQAAGIVYRILVSELSTGSLSALKYAEKITQLLTIIFLNSVTTVMYPLLSEKVSRHDLAGVRETIGSAIRLTTFLTVPLVIAVVFLREPLIALIYQRGSFTDGAAALTSEALLFLVVGLTTNGISSILGHATLALQKSRAAVAVTIVSQAVAIMLFVLLVPRLQHAGLALASSLVPLSSALLYGLYLNRFIPRLRQVFYHATFLKIGVLGSLLFVLLGGLQAGEVLMVPGSFAMTLVMLMGVSAVGMSLYFGGAYWWNIPEMRELLAMARGTLSAFKRRL